MNTETDKIVNIWHSLINTTIKNKMDARELEMALRTVSTNE